MAIPKLIEREHIFQAMIKIVREDVPKPRKEHRWAVKYEKQLFPCKLLISWGHLYATGIELDPNPKVFTTSMAQTFLKRLGFKIVHL